MRVLHIIEIRGIGGAENLIIDFIPSQLNTGMQVQCVILYMSKYKNDAVSFANRLATRDLEIRLVEFTNVLLLLPVLVKVQRLIKFSNPDIIHTHLRVAELVIALLKKHNLKVPVVTTAHGFADKFNYFKLRLFLVKRLIKDIEGHAFVSNVIKEFYLKYNLINAKSLTTIIHNGYRSIGSSPRVKPIDKNNIKLILWGRLVERKGHKYAIEAVKILKEKYPHLRLDFYGAGPFEKKIREMINDAGLQQNVFLRGFSENISQNLGAYDIALVPSFHEPFGMVFLEAFDAQIPVVAFDLPAGNEIIKQNVSGLLAVPSSSASLAEKIESLILDDKLRNKIITNGVQTLQDNFTIEKMSARYLAFYSEIIK